MKIGRVAQIIDDFESGRLLPCNPIRIYRIYDDEISNLAKLTHESQCVVKIAIDCDDFGFVGKSLQ